MYACVFCFRWRVRVRAWRETAVSSHGMMEQVQVIGREGGSCRVLGEAVGDIPSSWLAGWGRRGAEGQEWGKAVLGARPEW